MMKTILVPNAPWPKWELVPPKRSHPKKRVKPSEVDTNFEQWLKENTNGVRRR